MHRPMRTGVPRTTKLLVPAASGPFSVCRCVSVCVSVARASSLARLRCGGPRFEPSGALVGVNCDNCLFHKRHRYIDKMQQLSSHRPKEQATDPSKSPCPHEDVLNMFIASHAIDRCCNAAPLWTGDVTNSCLAAYDNSLS